MKTIIEPFKIKMVERIKMTTRQERQRYIDFCPSSNGNDIKLSGHADMGSCRAIVHGTLWVNTNPLPADLCRHPVHRDVVRANHPWPLGSGNPCRNDV